jgi:hypothetical protein
MLNRWLLPKGGSTPGGTHDAVAAIFKNFRSEVGRKGNVGEGYFPCS